MISDAEYPNPSPGQSTTAPKTPLLNWDIPLDQTGSAFAILQALPVISESLLQTDWWEQSIHTALSELGAAANASRAYIREIQLTPEGKSLSTVTAIWKQVGVSEKVPWETVDLDQTPPDQFAVWIDEMLCGRAVGGPVSSFSDKIADLLGFTDVKALLMLPIIAEGRWLGILTLEDT